MGEWVCKSCGAREFGMRFWRLRNSNGGEITSRPNLADLRRFQRQYAWAKDTKIFRVTRSAKDSACYWPPDKNPAFAEPVKKSARAKRKAER